MIDESSPLYGKTPEDLEKSDTRLMTSIVCIDSVVPQRRSSARPITYADILWNRRFVEIYTATSDGRLTVDYGRFNDTEET